MDKDKKNWVEKKQLENTEINLGKTSPTQNLKWLVTFLNDNIFPNQIQGLHKNVHRFRKCTT